MIRLAFSGAEMLKLPLASVDVPPGDPFTVTVAPARGWPLSSLMVPVTVLVWPKIVSENSRKNRESNNFPGMEQAVDRIFITSNFRFNCKKLINFYHLASVQHDWLKKTGNFSL